jgi:hypothetical protein
MKHKSSMDSPLKDDSVSLNIIKYTYFYHSLVFYQKIEVVIRFKKELKYVLGRTLYF